MNSKKLCKKMIFGRNPKDFSKTRKITLKISKIEEEKLRALAKTESTTISDLIRSGKLDSLFSE